MVASGGRGNEHRAIIILFSILEMRPKEFRGLSNCEMSRDTSSLFPLPATNRETKNLPRASPTFINENIRNFCLSAKIVYRIFCRRYSYFSIPSIRFSLFPIQFISTISRDIQVYINQFPILRIAKSFFFLFFFF